MAYPLDSCPPEVKNGNEFSDTLVAMAPYQNVSTAEVQVPPVADKDAPFVRAVRTNVTLTPNDGTWPSGTWGEGTPAAYAYGRKDLPGWNGQAEYAERGRLRNVLKAIYDETLVGDLASGPIHPDGKKLLQDLTVAATNRLNSIKAIYDKWASRRYPSKYGNQTPDGLQDLALSQAVFDYTVWGAQTTPQQRGGYVQSWFFGQPQYLEQIGYQGNINQIPQNVFWMLLLAEQIHDRNRIRDLYREAYKMLWCAEFGVAQSQSYYSNKATWDAGPGGKQIPSPGYAPTPPAAPHPGPAIALGGLATPTPPGGEQPVPPPGSGSGPVRWPGPPPSEPVRWAGPAEPPTEPPAFPEDADASSGPDAGPGAPPPPSQQPDAAGREIVGPVLSTPTPWYKTTAGKIGLTVVVIGAVAGTGYGIYRYVQASPRAA